MDVQSANHLHMLAVAKLASGGPCVDRRDYERKVLFWGLKQNI